MQYTMSATMRVHKRGTRGFEEVHFDKIVARLRNLCTDIAADVDPILIAQAVISNIYDGITTEELDRISARAAESYKMKHPSYGKLAARVLVSNLHKTTPGKFSECFELIYNRTGNLSVEALKFVRTNAAVLDGAVDCARDYNYDYLGYTMLESTYLRRTQEPDLDHNGNQLYITKKGTTVPGEQVRQRRGVYKAGKQVVWPKTREVVIDRPQYMLMRVAIAVSRFDVQRTVDCYNLLSAGYAVHATPTNFNACSPVQQLNSCFLLGMRDDTRDIMDTLTDASIISKNAGGIGIWVHDTRPAGSLIATTQGRSSGIPKQLPVFDRAAVCWNQGGKRKGSFAIYLEPWHGDILEFLELKHNTRGEAKELFYAMWVPDLFVKRALAREDWCLFSSVSAPGLSDVYDGMPVCKHCRHCVNSAYNQYVEPALADCPGHVYEPVDAFTALYERYEEAGLAIDVMPAWDILDAICESQRDNGTPYVCFKDHVNRCTNQQNIGTIKSSNLCTEIMEWSSPDSYACCTLASINLPKFVDVSGAEPVFDHVRLAEVVRFLVESLDNVIDANVYPVPECEVNSQTLRPIGLGVQGLANAFAMMGLPYLSEEAAQLDAEIFETIYYAALDASSRLAQTRGSYEGFIGSPASQGILSQDQWLANQQRLGMPVGQLRGGGRYDWDVMRQQVSRGLRNSLMVAPMPTVSTSVILGNTESFEPFGPLIGTRAGIVGKTTVCNTLMIQHLMKLGIWNENVKRDIINNDGTLAGLEYIPAKSREIFKTVNEMRQSELMKRAAMRQAYIDQSQSLNIFLNDNTNAILRAVFFGAWKNGQKTGSYYIRTQPATSAMRNNIAETTAPAAQPEITGAVCMMEDGCLMCGS